MKKKFLNLSLILMMFVSLIPNYANAQQPIKLMVDGKEVKSDVAPFIQNGRTMVPIRFIGETLGMTVTYEDGVWEDSKTAVLTAKNGRQIYVDEILINSSDGITYNTGDPESDPSRVIRNNRTFVPVRYIANALHMDVIWDSSTQTVELKTNNNSDTYPITFTSFNGYSEIPIKSEYMQIQYKNGNYILKSELLDEEITVAEYLDTIYQDGFLKGLADGLEIPFENIYDIELTFYGNNYFIMNPERTEIKAISAS